MNDYFVEIDVEISTASADAYLVTDGYSEGWIPKSLINNYDTMQPNPLGVVTIEIPRWKAEEMGMDE